MFIRFLRFFLYVDNIYNFAVVILTFNILLEREASGRC